MVAAVVASCDKSCRLSGAEYFPSTVSSSLFFSKYMLSMFTCLHLCVAGRRLSGVPPTLLAHVLVCATRLSKMPGKSLSAEEIRLAKMWYDEDDKTPGDIAKLKRRDKSCQVCVMLAHARLTRASRGHHAGITRASR